VCLNEPSKTSDCLPQFAPTTVPRSRRPVPCLDYPNSPFSVVFASQLVGLREVDDQVWQVSFMEYDLGYFDKEQDRVEPGPNPFKPDKV